MLGGLWWGCCSAAVGRWGDLWHLLAKALVLGQHLQKRICSQSQGALSQAQHCCPATLCPTYSRALSKSQGDLCFTGTLSFVFPWKAAKGEVV